MPDAVFDAWAGFFAAQIGAAAALAGLLFVGLSLNLTKILSFPELPNRALLALGVLLAILVVSSVFLIPGQPLVLLGVEILAIGAAMTLAGIRIEMYMLRDLATPARRTFLPNMIFLLCALLPYVVGGLLIARGELSGLYWIAAAIVLSFVKAVADAWVLLVEINR